MKCILDRCESVSIVAAFDQFRAEACARPLLAVDDPEDELVLRFHSGNRLRNLSSWVVRLCLLSCAVFSQAFQGAFPTGSVRAEDGIAPGGLTALTLAWLIYSGGC